MLRRGCSAAGALHAARSQPCSLFVRRWCAQLDAAYTGRGTTASGNRFEDLRQAGKQAGGASSSAAAGNSLYCPLSMPSNCVAALSQATVAHSCLHLREHERQSGQGDGCAWALAMLPPAARPATHTRRAAHPASPCATQAGVVLRPPALVQTPSPSTPTSPARRALARPAAPGVKLTRLIVHLLQG